MNSDSIAYFISFFQSALDTHGCPLQILKSIYNMVGYLANFEWIQYNLSTHVRVLYPMYCTSIYTWGCCIPHALLPIHMVRAWRKSLTVIRGGGRRLCSICLYLFGEYVPCISILTWGCSIPYTNTYPFLPHSPPQPMGTSFFIP